MHNTQEEDNQEARELVIDKYAEIVVRVADKLAGKDIIERAFGMRRTLAAMITEYLSVGADDSNKDKQ